MTDDGRMFTDLWDSDRRVEDGEGEAGPSAARRVPDDVVANVRDVKPGSGGVRREDHIFALVIELRGLPASIRRNAEKVDVDHSRSKLSVLSSSTPSSR